MGLKFNYKYLILILMVGLSSCDPPANTVANTQPTVVKEELGTPGLPLSLSLSQYEISLTLDQRPLELTLDFSTNSINYHLFCAEHEFTGEVPVPRSLSEGLQNIISESSICRIHYEYPEESEVVRCMAFSLPWLTLEMANGETLPLYKGGQKTICLEGLNFLCDPNAEATLDKLTTQTIELIPKCD